MTSAATQKSYADALFERCYYKHSNRANAVAAISTFYYEILDPEKVSSFAQRLAFTQDPNADESASDVIDEYIKDFFYYYTEQEKLEKLEDYL